VGAYTGNAIASIACLEPVAVVDANVVRVVSRLRRLASDPRGKAAVAAQTALADALLDPQRPGDFNQVRARLSCAPANTRLRTHAQGRFSTLVYASQTRASGCVCRCTLDELSNRRAGSHGAGRYSVHGTPAAVVRRVPAAKHLPGVR
jgi:hypothetical protein